MVNDAAHAVASDLAAALLDLPAEMQPEALSFIQYLKHKSESGHAGLSADNQSVAKKAKPYPKQKEVADKYLLSKISFDAPLRSTPVVANGVLYVMSEKTLFAIKPKK